MILWLLLVALWAKDPFVERAEALGVDFIHQTGGTGKFYYPEINGSGAALFDYDNDGDLDLFLCQSGTLRPGWVGGLPSRVYRNDLQRDAQGKTTLRFVDVTGKEGPVMTGYALGAAPADYDNDGRVDLYVTAFGANRLFRNLGGGAFEDVTEQAGVGDTRFSMSAAWVDIDRDNDLDLFVTNYARYSFANHKNCVTPSGVSDYCGPDSYDDQEDRLYLNLGNGRFQDISLAAGLHKAFGSGMGVTVADFDRNGWMDFYVANDADANQLWLNQDGKSFIDDALVAGTAFDADGNAEAGMGVVAGDYDNDGDLDLLLTHLTGETHTLYRNEGDFFEDAGKTVGLGASTLEATGWGVAFFDYDNDTDLDLYGANGAVKRIERLVAQNDPNPYHQTNQLFRNDNGVFNDISSVSGPALALSEVSRGAAFGDLDNDGDVDIVVMNNGGRTRILINQVGQENSWVGAVPKRRNGRAAMGAELRLSHPDGRIFLRRAGRDGSFLSGNDPRVLFGLGSDTLKSFTIEVRWPNSTRERFTLNGASRYHEVREGAGTPAP